MQRIRLLLELGKPRILALMCLLTLAGAALSPRFLAPDFPPTRLSRLLPGRFPPALWSLAHAVGAVLVVGLLWLGTALINDLADRAVDAIANPERPLPTRRIRPEAVLRWALGLQTVAFLLVLAEGTRTDLLLCLLGAGLGNAYSLPPLRLRRSGIAANMIIGGGVVLAMTGGMLAQGAVTRVGLLSAAALGILAATVSMVKDFKDCHGDRQEGIHTLPVLLGTRAAALANMALVAAAYLLATFLLIQHIGVQVPVITLMAALGAVNLHLLAGFLGSPGPGYARKAYRRAVFVFMGVTLLYVGAQALYQGR